jgi:hypothetical protein
MSTKVSISPSDKNVEIGVNFNTIEVSNPNLPTSVEVTQPITKTVEIVTLGPKGPKGDDGNSFFTEISPGIYSTTSSVEITGSFSVNGPVSLDLFRIITGSVIAQVNTPNNIFSLISGSNEFITVNQSTTTITNDFFLVKNNNDENMLHISGGVFYFQTQSQELTNDVSPGAFYFTSSSFFVSLENS